MDSVHNGLIEPWETGWVAKFDRPGVAPFVEYEYYIYQLLDKGLSRLLG
jgi:hypothetical protein